MIATVTGFFLSVFAAFFMEFLEKTKADPKAREGLERLKRFSGLKGEV